MPFFETLLGPLGSEPADDPYARFRSSDPREVMALLGELRDSGNALVLAAPDGLNLAATVKSADERRERITFDVEAGDPQLPGLVEANEATAVAYLASVKLQFELHDLVLVRGPHGTALQARLPRHVYRFQRRTAFRVRTLERGAPMAYLRHPSLPDMPLALRIADISISGCALLLPDDVPPLQPESELNGVRLDLDADTTLNVGLRIQHVSSGVSANAGQRLGCEFLQRDSSSERVLQRYIDHTQKRRRLLSLD